MTNTPLIAVFAVIFPIAVFLGGSWLMTKVTVGDWKKNDRPNLGMSPTGYKVETIKSYWRRAPREDLQAEERFLRLDFIFAIVYSSAIALSLVALGTLAGLNFHPAWLLLPVVVTLFSDWAENALQLSQIGRTLAAGVDAVNDRAVRAASVATILKLWSALVSTGVLIWLALRLIRTR